MEVPEILVTLYKLIAAGTVFMICKQCGTIIGRKLKHKNEKCDIRGGEVKDYH